MSFPPAAAVPAGPVHAGLRDSGQEAGALGVAFPALVSDTLPAHAVGGESPAAAPLRATLSPPSRCWQAAERRRGQGDTGSCPPACRGGRTSQDRHRAGWPAPRPACPWVPQSVVAYNVASALQQTLLMTVQNSRWMWFLLLLIV